MEHASSVSPTPTISESPFSPLILSLPDAFEGAYGVDQYDEVPSGASTIPDPLPSHICILPLRPAHGPQHNRCPLLAQLEFDGPDLLQGSLSELKLAVQRQATPGRILLRDKLTFLAGVTGCLCATPLVLRAFTVTCSSATRQMRTSHGHGARSKHPAAVVCDGGQDICTGRAHGIRHGWGSVIHAVSVQQ